MKNKLIYKIFYTSLFIIHFSFGFSQDIHFTQFNSSPLTLNPANTGLFYGDYRVSLIDRNQWAAVTVPFQTFSASIDTKLLTRNYQKDMIGIGLVFYRDKAGDSDFGTTDVNVSLSYTKCIDKLAKHFLTFAFEGGLAQRSMNFNKLTFDNQYNGFMFDPTIQNNQDLITDNFIFGDLSAGINWLYMVKQNVNISSGISLFHINRPEQSILKDGHSKLNQRISAYVNLEAEVSDKIDLAPSILLMHQGTYQEVNLGMFVKFIKDRSINNYTSLNAGVFSREYDALNIIIGFDYKKGTFGLSYDINYSDLHKASYSRGGYEISLIYRIFNVNKKNTNLPACRIM